VQEENERILRIVLNIALDQLPPGDPTVNYYLSSAGHLEPKELRPLVEKFMANSRNGPMAQETLVRWSMEYDADCRTKALQNPDPARRCLAIQELASFRCRASLPLIIERLGDPDSDVRDLALDALQVMDPPPKYMKEALESRNATE
jgi:HEAT repeat protein